MLVTVRPKIVVVDRPGNLSESENDSGQWRCIGHPDFLATHTVVRKEVSNFTSIYSDVFPIYAFCGFTLR